jgi:hypothetical protein
MPNDRPTSFAKTIDPEGSIQGKPLKPEFEKVAEKAPEQPHTPQPGVNSRQVAQTQHKPAAPAPNPYARTLAARGAHTASTEKDDKVSKAYSERAARLIEQKKTQKTQAPKSKSLGHEREIGD